MTDVLSDQGDQLGTTDGGKIPRGDMGRRHEGQEGSGTIYQPKVERHSKGGCATPRLSAASPCHSLGADLGANPYSAIFRLCELEYSP